ncbi:MAG: nitroreductase family protein [Brevinematales bacterium]|nr:nitroreductase family protein [Brevinematales bacterium]
MNAIFKRKSIRSFKSKWVSERLIKKILMAGMAAPSSWNSKPWVFIVIRDKKILDEIAEKHGYANMCRESNCAILVCGNPENMKEKDFLPQDCSAATENMLIEATYLGLGSVWVGLFPKEDRMNLLKQLVSLPENIIPFSLVVLGYPAEKKKWKKSYYGDKVYLDKWGNKPKI